MAAAAVLSATTGQAQQSYTGRPNAEQPVSVLTTASSTGMVPDRHSDSRSITGSLPNVSILNEINIESTKQQQQQQQFHQDMIKVDALANMGLLTNVDVNSSNSAYFS